MSQVGGQLQTQRVRQRTHEGFLRHKGYRWLQIAIVLCVAAVAAYWWYDVDARRTGAEPPSGGTWLGYILGTVGAGLIVWLSSLGLRKRMVSDNYYSLKAWVSAHVYLGLSLIVIATLHTGFKFGWNIHTLAYGLMLLVIVSGIFGIWAYATLPRRLHSNRGEVTRKKMIEDVESLDAQLHVAAQPLGHDAAAIVRSAIENTELGGGFWTRLFNTYGNCPTTRAIARLQPLMRSGSTETETLRQVEQLLKQKAEVLALARRQMQITALLEAWLFVHIPSTFALLAALTAHIVSVFLYW